MPDVQVVWEIIRNAGELAMILPAWRAFIQRPDVRSGFYTDPEALAGRLRWDGSVWLEVAVVFRGSEVVAYIPFIVKERPAAFCFGPFWFGKYFLRHAELADFDFPRVADSANPKQDPALAYFQAVLGSWSEQTCSPDVLFVESVSVSQMNNSRRPDLFLRNIQSTYLAELPEDIDAYWANMTSSQRWRLKKKMRIFLENQADAVEVSCYRARGDMEILKRHLDAVHLKSWQGITGGVCPPPLHVLQNLAGLGWVRSYVLKVADQPVACILGYQRNGVYDYAAPAYDASWGERMPGIYLLNHLFVDLYLRDRPDVVDFGFGYNDYKKTFGTREDKRGNLRIGITVRGRFYDRIQRFFDAIYRGIHSSLSGTQLFKRLRQRHRGG